MIIAGSSPTRRLYFQTYTELSCIYRSFHHKFDHPNKVKIKLKKIDLIHLTPPHTFHPSVYKITFSTCMMMSRFRQGGHVIPTIGSRIVLHNGITDSVRLQPRGTTQNNQTGLGVKTGNGPGGLKYRRNKKLHKDKKKKKMTCRDNWALWSGACPS